MLFAETNRFDIPLHNLKPLNTQFVLAALLGCRVSRHDALTAMRCGENLDVLLFAYCKQSLPNQWQRFAEDAVLDFINQQNIRLRRENFGVDVKNSVEGLSHLRCRHGARQPKVRKYKRGTCSRQLC